jgi:hypothetical protein
MTLSFYFEVSGIHKKAFVNINKCIIIHRRFILQGTNQWCNLRYPVASSLIDFDFVQNEVHPT